MSEVYRILIEFSGEDAELLDALRARLGKSRADLLRWALRYYAVAGPWRRRGERPLAPLVERGGEIEVAPGKVRRVG